MGEAASRPARKIVLIGGSAGAIEALSTVIGSLPADFPAAICVVIHTSAEAPSVLPQVLARAGVLPAEHAREGELIRAGHIYVAPPDFHIGLGPRETLEVRRGPRENGHRPAIDVLFRSAVANGYGPRLVAVVLSGYLDDGSAGLYAVRTRGGIAIAQDPADAIGPDMPANALRHAGADYVLPSGKIGAKLLELVQQLPKVIPMVKKKKTKAESRRSEEKPSLESPMANAHVSYPEEGTGTPSVFACPECHGVLWEIREGGPARYRCRVGHAFSQGALNQELSHAAESALWAAMRALDEKAAMSRRMALNARGPQRWTARLHEQAETYATHAEILRRMILGEPSAEEEAASSKGVERA